jgi:hypothetical protein
MKKVVCSILLISCGICLFAQSIGSDSLSANIYADSDLFKDETAIEMCLKGDIRKLFRDRSDEADYHPFTLSYSDVNGDSIHLDINIKTRGHFRRLRENCSTPPLLLKFSDANNTLFQGQNKLKLVTACTSEKFVYREYLIYKIYQLITQKGFKVRLVKLRFDDNIRNRKSEVEYAYLLEDHKRMAARNASSLIKRLNLNPIKTERDAFIKMAMFQYLIGNTDWSIQYLHNIKLISGNENASLIPVPYDFDHSGLVNAPYAIPAEALKLKSVRERRYRGYCIEKMSAFDESIALFNSIKKDLYKIYMNDTVIEKAYLKSTIKYFDTFYETINSTKKSKAAFQYPCNHRETGSIVIKGLKDH